METRILLVAILITYVFLPCQSYNYAEGEDEEDEADEFISNLEKDECSDSSYCYSTSNKCCGYKSPQWGSTCRSGKLQSPINLPSCTKDNMSTLTMDGDQYKGRFSMYNNGGTVMIQFMEGEPRTVEISKIGAYNLNHIEFHWGKHNQSGTEHCIKKSGEDSCTGETMEVQLVHYKADKENMEEAISSTKKNAVLIISLLLRATNVTTDSNIHPVLSSVTKQMMEIEEYGNNVTAKNTLDLSPWLSLPSAASMYYGSFTSPRCQQVVRWLVLHTPIPVKHADVEPFRLIRQINGKPLLKNRRPSQKRNGRDVSCFQLKVSNLSTSKGN